MTKRGLPVAEVAARLLMPNEIKTPSLVFTCTTSTASRLINSRGIDKQFSLRLADVFPENLAYNLLQVTARTLARRR